MTKKIAIIGGGASGLAAATALEHAKRAGGDLEYILFERDEQLGGVMRTEVADDCLIEAGPDSFLSEKTTGAEFCRLFGMGDQIIGSNDGERITYILVKNRLIPMPDGLMFMVPTKILPTVTTPLFTWSTKIKMGLELMQRPPAKNGDETVADLVRRHYGQEVVERLADPLLAGVYGGDAANLSVKAVLPRFADMEAKYGSLSRGMLAARKKMQDFAKAQGPGYKPRPLFSSLQDGMQQMVDAVAKFLPQSAVRTGAAISAAGRHGEKWKLAVGGGSQEFDGLIIATPAHVAGSLLGGTDGELARELNGVSYSSSITVVMTYSRADLQNMPPGFGFLVPKTERRRIRALTFVHNKFPHRAPTDKGIVRVFLGGLSDPDVLSLSDGEVLATVRTELKEIVGLTGEPRVMRVYRWNRSMAQYGPGHLERVARIQQRVSAIPKLALAGNAFQGIGVPDCLASGLTAAMSVCDQLGIPKPDLKINLKPAQTR
ncbi:MAG TPA: protoporphyrinogen oxidase [Terriglobales bacterium]|nr:protoporphyrinogen oxidase [Terriglobales bacterium]